MKFYIIHAFSPKSPEYCSNLGTLCTTMFILPSYFLLEKKHIIIALYLTLFAVSLIRANLRKINTDVVPGSGNSRTSFPGCLVSFSYVTKGFSGQANINSSYPKYLHNTKGTQTHNLPLWRARWPFKSRNQLWTEGFDTGGGTSTCSLWGSPTKPTSSFIPFKFLNFCFTSLHVPSFHHLQDFPAYVPTI